MMDVPHDPAPTPEQPNRACERDDKRQGQACLAVREGLENHFADVVGGGARHDVEEIVRLPQALGQVRHVGIAAPLGCVHRVERQPPGDHEPLVLVPERPGLELRERVEGDTRAVDRGAPFEQPVKGARTGLVRLEELTDEQLQELGEEFAQVKARAAARLERQRDAVVEEREYRSA
jgi:hypothetical protein